MAEEPVVFSFGDFELDEERRELRRAGTPVELQLRPFQLLAYLVRNSDRAVPREELFERIWADTAVSDAALSSALRDVRRVLGDDGTDQTWIRTQRGRGLRFVAPVEERLGLREGAGAERRLARPVGAIAVAVALLVGGFWWLNRAGPEIPSIRSVAVLSFVDMSPEGDQEYFGDGMAEALSDTLSRVDGLRVVARTSAFAFKGQNEDIRSIGEQLGVGAVVEGSVRKAGDRIRITAQLVRAEDGFHLWSQTYDRELDDVFSIQDEIARAVSEALRVRLAGAPLRSARDLRAYELYLVGRHLEASA